MRSVQERTPAVKPGHSRDAGSIGYRNDTPGLRHQNADVAGVNDLTPQVDAVDIPPIVAVRA